MSLNRNKRPPCLLLFFLEFSIQDIMSDRPTYQHSCTFQFHDTVRAPDLRICCGAVHCFFTVLHISMHSLNNYQITVRLKSTFIPESNTCTRALYCMNNSYSGIQEQTELPSIHDFSIGRNSRIHGHVVTFCTVLNKTLFSGCLLDLFPDK